MSERDQSILNTLNSIRSLRYFLKSEMSIDNNKGEEAILKIKVYNDAHANPDGGNIIFIDVGLHIIVDSPMDMHNIVSNWHSRIKKSRLSDCKELFPRSDQGMWVGVGVEQSSLYEFESYGKSKGEVLYPGESVLYEIKTPKAALPYMDIRVAGAISRRDLFRLYQPLEALKPWAQPLIVETFRALDAIDFYKPILPLINVMPAFNPETTLADIEAFRNAIEKAKQQIQEVWRGVTNITHSAPNQKLRNYCDKYMDKGLGIYFLSAVQTCDRVAKALSSSDMKKMKEAAEEIKGLVTKAEEARHTLVELKSQFGIMN